MKRIAFVVAGLLAAAPALAQQGTWRPTSDTSVGGFEFPESVGCDAKGKAIYVGNFGGAKLAPAEKDGLGYISKVGLDGKVLEKRFLPAGGEKMNKPKGIWISGSRLWVTDIDAVWVFDTKTKKGRRLPLPGVGFANDPAILDGALYISDNRNDLMVKVEPADFLNAKKEPKITQVFKGEGVFPNGVYPTRAGQLLMVGFVAPDKPQGIYLLGASGQIKKLSVPIGRLDGVWELNDGSLLVTDWNSGSLFRWTDRNVREPIATGFKGPADFCVMQEKNELTVYVPDLVQSQLRIVKLKK